MAKRTSKGAKQLKKAQQEQKFNANGRYYPPEVLKAAVDNFNAKGGSDTVSHLEIGEGGLDMTGWLVPNTTPDAGKMEFSIRHPGTGADERMRELYRKDPVAHGKMIDEQLLNETFGRISGGRVFGKDPVARNLDEETTRKENLMLAVPSIKTVYPEETISELAGIARMLWPSMAGNFKVAIRDEKNPSVFEKKTQELLDALNAELNDSGRRRVVKIMEEAKDSDLAMRALYSSSPIKNLQLLEAGDVDGLNASLKEEAMALTPQLDSSISEIAEPGGPVKCVLGQHPFRSVVTVDPVTGDFVAKQMLSDDPVFDKFPLPDPVSLQAFRGLMASDLEFRQDGILPTGLPVNFWNPLNRSHDCGFKMGEIFLQGPMRRDSYGKSNIEFNVYFPHLTTYVDFRNKFYESNPNATREQFYEHLKATQDQRTLRYWRAAAVWRLSVLSKGGVDDYFGTAACVTMEEVRIAEEMVMPAELVGSDINRDCVKIPLESLNYGAPWMPELVDTILLHTDKDKQPGPVTIKHLKTRGGGITSNIDVAFGMRAMVGEDGVLTGPLSINQINPFPMGGHESRGKMFTPVDDKTARDIQAESMKQEDEEVDDGEEE